MNRRHQALIPAPAPSDREQLQRLDEPRPLRLPAPASEKANSPAAPLKSRRQISCPGQSGSAGCSTRPTSGRLEAIARSRAPPPPAPAAAPRASAARAAPARRHRARPGAPGRTSPAPAPGTTQAWPVTAPKHQVGMPADIFAARDHAHVRARRQRRKQQGRRPAIVQHHRHAARPRRCRDRRHVLHLER
jgi:hypothetical protein